MTPEPSSGNPRCTGVTVSDFTRSCTATGVERRGGADERGGADLRSSSGRWVVVATVVGSALASIDATVVTIALPAIGADLGTSFAGLQWTVTGYTLTLAALILLAGAAGDRFGRRRVFLVGVVWFGLASIACAVAPSIELLVGARVLQGVGAALLAPASLAILRVHVRGRRPRRRCSDLGSASQEWQAPWLRSSVAG